MRAHKSIAVVAFAVVLVGSALIASPAGAGEGETATLTVTKTVVGTAPADAEFVINVFCESDRIPDTIPDGGGIIELNAPQGSPIIYDEDITFGPTGGSEDFIFFNSAVCTITEIDDGGADSSSGPVEVFIDEPSVFDAEIVNTFDAAPVTTVPGETTTTMAPAAAAVTAAPTFTG